MIEIINELKKCSRQILILIFSLLLLLSRQSTVIKSIHIDMSLYILSILLIFLLNLGRTVRFLPQEKGSTGGAFFELPYVW